MEWRISADSPIYAQLARQMRLEIASGARAPGEKLPPVRELALSAGVNPNTMQRAMAELEREGLVYAQRTAGRFVTEDAGKIAAAHSALAREETEKYLRAMAALGCAPAEVAELVRETGEEDANADT